MASVTMIPVAMRRPTGKKRIHSPHLFEKPIEIPEWQLRQLESSPMSVSFEPDGVSNPRQRLAYFICKPGQKVWGHWYIIGGWECLETTTEQAKEAE